MSSERCIIIGDVHGCLEELDELLALVGYRGRVSRDRLVFAGDLVDRGPDPVGVVRRARELEADCVMGNHEEKHVRWARWNERVAAGEADHNPMRAFDEDRLNQHNGLSEEDLDYIRAMPTLVRPQPELIVVHAGLETDGTPPEDQDLNKVCRVRYVDKDGKRTVNKGDIFAPSEGATPWYQQWTGPETVVYGHDVIHNEGKILNGYRQCTNRHWDGERFQFGTTVGIDTGCVFGGWLTAVTFVPGSYYVHEHVSVKAKEEYHPMRRRR